MFVSDALFQSSGGDIGTCYIFSTIKQNAWSQPLHLISKYCIKGNLQRQTSDPSQFSDIFKNKPTDPNHIVCNLFYTKDIAHNPVQLVLTIFFHVIITQYYSERKNLTGKCTLEFEKDCVKACLKGLS